MLRTIKLHDFRNFSAASIPFGAPFTVLFGHNGAGKTNLIEAIYLVSTLRSFRCAELAPLIRKSCSAAEVALELDDPVAGLPTELSVQISASSTGARRTALENNKVVRSAKQFYGRVRSVLFTPEDLGVLRGGPSERRRLLDRVIFACERDHIADIAAYEKLLRSRNRLFRNDALNARDREALLGTYESQLAEVGARIWSRRTATLDALQAPFAAAFANIHGARGPNATSGTAIATNLRYACKLGELDRDQRATALEHALAEHRRTDALRGTTTVGPHRDDLIVDFDGQSAATFASQGQCRALVMAFKLAELQLVSQVHGRPPLLLLDDVSSELDPHRSELLFGLLGVSSSQCILTTTARDYIHLPPGAHADYWAVSEGRIASLAGV